MKNRIEMMSWDLAIVAAMALAAACSSTALTPPRHDSGSDAPVVSAFDSGRDTAAHPPTDAADARMTTDAAGADAGGKGGCPGHAPAPSEVPPNHRATAVSCGPNVTRWPGDGMSCTSNADCAADGNVNLLPFVCLHGHCTIDQCLTDEDCGENTACVCARGGLGFVRANTCLPANCRVDADCGTTGYCAASFGPCGSIDGYYCHTANDTCVNPTEDCSGCGSLSHCSYSPAAAAFTCALQTCAG